MLCRGARLYKQTSDSLNLKVVNINGQPVEITINTITRNNSEVEVTATCSIHSFYLLLVLQTNVFLHSVLICLPVLVISMFIEIQNFGQPALFGICKYMGITSSAS